MDICMGRNCERDGEGEGKLERETAEEKRERETRNDRDGKTVY